MEESQERHAKQVKQMGYMSVKAYRVISLLNCLGKVCEKVVADILAKWCKVNHVLHTGQMRWRRQRSAIYAVARVINKVQEVEHREK